MFRAIVETQWRWTRAYALVGTVLAFVIPVASLQVAQGAETANDFVSVMSRWGVWYALLAAALGLVVAFMAWTHDHRGRHVYALILPVPRARYALMRLGAGALFLLPPVVAVLLGGLAVATLGGYPQGLQAYPVALALRFGFAAIVSYSVFFTIASATPRAAGVVLGLVGAVLLTGYVFAVAEIPFDPIRKVAQALFSSPGIFSVFTGRWTLIDA
jgi:FtsH-binding integral membrane protein